MANGIVMGLASKKSALFSQYRRAAETRGVRQPVQRDVVEEVVPGQGTLQASLQDLFDEPGLAGAVAVVKHERRQIGG
jgi:hypothetical protein